MRTDGIGETVEEEDNGKGRKKFSLTDGQSSLTNSILGFVSPFHIQKVRFGESGVTWKGL